MLSEEVKKDIREEFLRNIHNVSNKDYQRRVWINGIGPECDSFDDFCCYFGEHGSAIIENYSQYGITEDRHQQLVKFQKTLADFPYRYDPPAEFINKPEWEDLIDQAKQILRVFNFLSEEAKKDIMEEFLEMIHNVSNKEYQRRVWINGIGPECDSFDEFCCNFDGLGSAVIEDYKRYGITDEQHQKLVKFQKSLNDGYAIFDEPDEFIDTPEWNDLVEQAKEIIKDFNFVRKPFKPSSYGKPNEDSK